MDRKVVSGGFRAGNEDLSVAGPTSDGSSLPENSGSLRKGMSWLWNSGSEGLSDLAIRGIGGGSMSLKSSMSSFSFSSVSPRSSEESPSEYAMDSRKLSSSFEVFILLN